jgi:hypothetical protein
MKAHRVFLLISWLIAAAAAWAQPAARTTGFIDSREECTALGGAWLANRGTWNAACQVPWGREDCLRLAGAWTPMGAAPAGGVCVAQVSVQATAQQCADSGGTWGPPGSSMPYCQEGTGRAMAPVRAASDANKACASQSDCLYGCVYGGPPVATGAQVAGHCRPTSQVQGCYAMVEKGRLAGNICMK